MEVGGLEGERGGHAVLDQAAALLAGPDLHAAVRQRHYHTDVRLHEAVAHARELIALRGQLQIGLFKLLVEFLLKGRIELLACREAVRVEVELLAVAHFALYGLVRVLFVHAVSHAVQVEALVRLHVVVHDGRAILLVGLLRVEHIRQRLVLDLYELAGRLCGLLVHGRDRRDHVADETHLLPHAVHDIPVGQVSAYRRAIRPVLAGDHADDAGQLLRLGGVDALYNAVRDGASEYFSVDHALGVDVRGVLRLARHFEQCVLADLALTYRIVFSHVSSPP